MFSYNQGIDSEPSHIADPLLVLQLQPRREWRLLADFGDELLVHSVPHFRLSKACCSSSTSW